MIKELFKFYFSEYYQKKYPLNTETKHLTYSKPYIKLIASNKGYEQINFFLISIEYLTSPFEEGILLNYEKVEARSHEIEDIIYYIKGIIKENYIALKCYLQLIKNKDTKPQEIEKIKKDMKIIKSYSKTLIKCIDKINYLKSKNTFNLLKEC